MRYDPERPPAPDEWLALDEGEAELLIMRHHRSPQCAHPPAPNPLLHAATHLVIENQAAAPDLPVADALRRLVAEGLTRHEAVHAVGSIVSRYLFAALRPEAEAPDIDRYFKEVAVLTAEAWRERADAESEDPNPFSALNDDALIDLLFTEADRLPRDAVDEVVTRGLTDRLIAIIADPEAWRASSSPASWATLHATFILGAIAGAAGDAALVTALREADARGNDQILGAMPGILGSRGARIRPTLLRILAERTEPPGVRCGAISGLAAGTLADPECRDDVFARVGDVFTAPHEDWSVRDHAALVLLDFQVEAYERALLDYAREAEAAHGDDLARGVTSEFGFDVFDVANAFSRPQDLSEYRDSWLDFYDADMIDARQERWRREAAERAARERETRTAAKVGRNDACPCGSGRKYKKCCLT